MGQFYAQSSASLVHVKTCHIAVAVGSLGGAAPSATPRRSRL